MEDAYFRRAEITRVLDGDTFEMFVNLGFGISNHIQVRLKGIDTPETWRPRCEAEAKHGRQATDFVVACFDQYSVLIQTFKDRASIYGRWTADVWLDTGGGEAGWELLADMLRENGLAKLDSYPADDETGSYVIEEEPA